MANRVHDLKTWPSYFEAVLRGEKRHEIRRNDRDYAVGDTLLLREWTPLACDCGMAGGDHDVCCATSQRMPDSDRYTGRLLYVCVTYVSERGKWDIPSDVVVMSISAPLRRWQCLGCRRLFLGAHHETCPCCNQLGYWTGSVHPEAVLWDGVPLPEVARG